MRPAFTKGFWLGSALAGGAYASFGKMPPKDQKLERDAEVDLIATDRAKYYPVADGKLTFDKLSSVFASGNKTRDDQPSHIRIETRVPRDVAQMWSRLCPAHVYEVGEEDAGKVVVHVTPSNCVQCGAITAKGGRLTPPEGGSGPEYTKT
jgi:electron-transferring-flavoprotein dehydrogenase